MPNVVMVAIETIDVNPFRLTSAYPYVERKLDALERSYADVGMWEGVIGRRAGNRVQCAFGHHRIEAARRSGMTEVPMIIRDLNDKQMLQFMGRENLEDYNADFLVMLETWEAGITYLGSSADEESVQPIEIARLLGWTTLNTDGEVILSITARACYAAHALISGGHLARADLADLSVASAREICERAQSRMETLERMGRQARRPREETETAKRHVGAAAKETVEQWRRGSIAQRDLRSQVDVNAYRGFRADKRRSPLFELFGKTLADGIARMLHNDSTSERLEEVCKSLELVTLDDDKRIVERLHFELGQLGGRAATWQKRVTPVAKKVTRLQITKGVRS